MTTISSADTDSEWISIPKKKSSVKKSTSNTIKLLAKGHAALSTTNEHDSSPDAVAASVRAGKLSIVTSKYFQFLVHSISKSVESKFDRIIAFGLGNLTSDTSKLQLILYLCLCDSLLTGDHSCTSQSVYDPCISAFDLKVLELLQIPVLSENTKGKHFIDDKGLTLFYLPHCPYRLYCNILWANWNNFDRLYLLGNSFQSYNMRRMDSIVVPTTRIAKGNTTQSHKTQTVEVDVTDTVALLTPFITEVDCWPAATHSRIDVDLPLRKDKGGNMASTAVNESLPVPVDVPAADRGVFLKEAKTLPALRHLENAMCDMSLMYFSAQSLSDRRVTELLAGSRASEALIDQASANDDELW